MKRRELLMLVASGGSVFAPSITSGSEHSLDSVVDPDVISSDEADSPMATTDEIDFDSDETDQKTVELTIELY